MRLIDIDSDFIASLFPDHHRITKLSILMMHTTKDGKMRWIILKMLPPSTLFLWSGAGNVPRRIKTFAL